MLDVKILTQPTDVTCGPTCLHAVYQYYGDDVSLEQVIKEVAYLKEGGTLAVLLGRHALSRGYKAKLYSYNLEVFDPTWFATKKVNLIEKLSQELQYKEKPKLRKTIKSYIEFLQMGGEVLLTDPSPRLFRQHFTLGMPILSGLSATYLYQSMREHVDEMNRVVYDDLRGEPSGHFVVLCGYDEEKKHVVVADPYKENPVSGTNYYSVIVGRLINSIMMGIMTYDANLLIIHPTF